MAGRAHPGHAALAPAAGAQVMSRLLLTMHGGFRLHRHAVTGDRWTPGDATADCVPQGCMQRTREHPRSYGAAAGCRSSAVAAFAGVAGVRLRGMTRYA